MSSPSSSLAPRRAFVQGLRESAPYFVVIVPFGIVFGVVATEAGFSVLETMGFSILVIAGASQLAAVQLMTENAPTLIVLATALAVNLRMAMYSASLAPHLGSLPLWQRSLVAYTMVDQAFAMAHARFEQAPGMSMAAKLAYYLGAVTLVCPMWYGATLGGAVLGNTIPPGLPIDFAVPITFLALVAPMLRTLAHVAAAFVSVAGTLLLAFMPYNTGVLVAAVLAMAVGAQVELWARKWRRGS